MGFLNFEIRPGQRVGTTFEDIDAFFTSNYIFALQFVSNKLVLDVGCGTGYGAKYLADRGGNFVIGIDIDGRIIRKCKEYYCDVKNLKFMLCNPLTLEFQSEFFDVVVSMEVIEHVRDYNRYLEEVYRVLKKGGVFIIATPNKNIYSPSLAKPIMIGHVKEFYPQELASLLAKYFSNVKMYGKKIINNSFLQKQKNFESSWRYIVVKNLSQFGFIKSVGKCVPYSIRKIFSGIPPVRLKTEDILITENDIHTARSLIAVCYK